MHCRQVNIKMTLTPINQFHNGGIKAVTTQLRAFAVDPVMLSICGQQWTTSLSRCVNDRRPGSPTHAVRSHRG